MYGIPKELKLDGILNTECTQVRVGQFDIQFSFGDFSFSVQSKISVFKGEREVTIWQGGNWPDPVFYEIMNVPLKSAVIENEKLIILSLENGVSLHLHDDSEHYETMQISIKGEEAWII